MFFCCAHGAKASPARDKKPPLLGSAQWGRSARKRLLWSVFKQGRA